MEKITLGNECLVCIDGTSDGTQDKYYQNGIWYKTDRYGNEGFNEELVSQILRCTNLPVHDYVLYHQIKINNEPGCYSKSFLKENEEYISIYRLHRNVAGIDIATKFSSMDFEEQADYVVSFVKKETGVDISKQLGDIFLIDKLIVNDDRHFNNIGFIFDGNEFRLAPIFDNGKSFFCGNPKYKESNSYKDNMRMVRFRPFTATIGMMQQRFPSEIQFDWEKVNSLLENLESKKHKDILLSGFYSIIKKDEKITDTELIRFQNMYSEVG
ncbi:MAG: hypothetical protein ACI4GW_02705 [Lachnospiraceae bacterium]